MTIYNQRKYYFEQCAMCLQTWLYNRLYYFWFYTQDHYIFQHISVSQYVSVNIHRYSSCTVSWSRNVRRHKFRQINGSFISHELINIRSPIIICFPNTVIRNTGLDGRLLLAASTAQLQARCLPIPCSGIVCLT